VAFVEFSALGQFVQGLRIGYIPPPQAFVALNPIPRVLDTRTGPLGKLNANEERRVTLTGVPGFAASAVINLTVTDTEGAGYVAVFPPTSSGQATRASTGPTAGRSWPTASSRPSTRQGPSRSAVAWAAPTSSSTYRGTCSGPIGPACPRAG
jgi:hypothetical protein